MRWGELFEHLEHVSADDSRRSPHRSNNGPRQASTFLAGLVSARKSHSSVTLGVVTGDILTIAPRSIGSNWFTGLVGGEDGSALLIPAHAIDWVEGPVTDDETEGSIAPVDISEVLVDLARRHVRVVCHLRGGPQTGVITAVGGEWFDLGAVTGAQPAGARRIGISGLVYLRYGYPSWG